MSYKQIEASTVLAKLSSGADIRVVDFPTGRIIDASSINISAVVYFISNGALFFEVVK